MINNIISYGYNNGVVVTAPLFFKEVFIMKKFFTMMIATVLTICAFAGCGTQDAVSEMGSGVSEVASDVANGMESMGDAMSGGTVSDTDGIIGNEATDGTTDNTSSAENNSDNQNDTTPSDELM